MSNLPVPPDYTVLREESLQFISAGKDRAQTAVDREKVGTYWEIGRVLHGHFLIHKGRAEFGQCVVGQLALDLGLTERFCTSSYRGLSGVSNFEPGFKIELGSLS